MTSRGHLVDNELQISCTVRVFIVVCDVYRLHVRYQGEKEAQGGTNFSFLEDLMH